MGTFEINIVPLHIMYIKIVYLYPQVVMPHNYFGKINLFNPLWNTNFKKSFTFQAEGTNTQFEIIKDVWTISDLFSTSTTVKNSFPSKQFV